MITIHIQNPNGSARDITGKPGKSLMEAAVAADIDGIAADCGGLLTCATCHVYVREPFASDAALLPPASGDEIAMLDFAASPRKPGSRLSCQINLTAALDGLKVELPPSQY
ncbi:MAG: 2Fe-2S iron-sulfur cluster binding domain-containing protein [Comamonadaceae bacterium]|nr:MAG: 2Fe-2S iron-sulfur cluster binding domain-containing protein [Comamonadaceae bacterium]